MEGWNILIFYISDHLCPYVVYLHVFLLVYVCVCVGGDCMMYMCFVPKGKTAAIQYNTKISLIDCLLATETSV